MNWEEIIDEDDDDENWVDPGAPSSGRSHPSNVNGNDNSEGQEENMKGGANGTEKMKGANDGKWKWKGQGKRNGERNRGREREEKGKW